MTEGNSGVATRFPLAKDHENYTNENASENTPPQLIT